MLKDVFSGVFTNSSYLTIAPLRLPWLAAFGLGFIRAADRRGSSRGRRSLTQLAQGILPSLDRFGADGVDISGGGSGYLMTSSDPESLRASRAGFEAHARRGGGEAPGPLLSPAELRVQEPALAPTVSGGFMLPGEFSLDPVTFVGSLIARLESAGVEVLAGRVAVRVGPDANVRCRDAEGRASTVSGDRVVIATGAWSSSLLKRSGIRTRAVVAGKGYSFTVPVERMPRTLIHSMDRHCLAVPMHGRLRIVGMMEFDGRPTRFNADRVALLARAASGLIAGADWEARTDEWVGPRPMTADGLPIIGPVPGNPGAIVASGHNMHGLSLGPITGDIVADLVAGRTPKLGGRAIDMTPFAV